MENGKNTPKSLLAETTNIDRLFSFEDYLMQRLVSQFNNDVLFQKTIGFKEFNLFANRWFRCSKEDAFKILKFLELKGLVIIKHHGFVVNGVKHDKQF